MPGIRATTSQTPPLNDENVGDGSQLNEQGNDNAKGVVGLDAKEFDGDKISIL